jgi:Cft2 family RNA processing exonuclease
MMTGSIIWCLKQADGRYSVRELWSDGKTKTTVDYMSVDKIETAQKQPVPEISPEPIDIKEQAQQLFEQVKPLAYQNPQAVNEALNEVYTPDEINGVLSAKVFE